MVFPVNFFQQKRVCRQNLDLSCSTALLLGKFFFIKEFIKQVDEGPGNATGCDCQSDPYSSRSKHLISLMQIDMLL